MDSRDSLISYKSISQESDAFIFSEQFVPYYELEINGIFSADNLEFEKYTAGSTDNPEDYKLPDVNNIVLPNKLSRINAFNKNNKESLLVSCDNLESNNEIIVLYHSFVSGVCGLNIYAQLPIKSLCATPPGIYVYPIA